MKRVLSSTKCNLRTKLIEILVILDRSFCIFVKVGSILCIQYVRSTLFSEREHTHHWKCPPPWSIAFASSCLFVLHSVKWKWSSDMRRGDCEVYCAFTCLLQVPYVQSPVAPPHALSVWVVTWRKGRCHSYTQETMMCDYVVWTQRNNLIGPYPYLIWMLIRMWFLL